MTSIGAYEAKTHLPRLLDQVEKGESFTITKHGREVARLVPVDLAWTAPGLVIQAVFDLRSQLENSENEPSLRELIEYGRR